MNLINKQLEKMYNDMATENSPKKVSYEYIESLMSLYEHNDIIDNVNNTHLIIFRDYDLEEYIKKTLHAFKVHKNSKDEWIYIEDITEKYLKENYEV